MAAAHQHSAGGGKRTRFLNRLFPWRSSSPNRHPSSSSSTRTSRFLLPDSSSTGSGVHFTNTGSSMRRTSPVDLHLGEATTTVLSPPSSPLTMIRPSPPFRERRTSHTASRPQPATSITPEQLDREELGALRHLATELHTALRISEEENLLLKAKLQTMDEWGLLEDQHQQFVQHSNQPTTAKLDQLIEELRDIASSQPTSPFSSPYVHRRNMRDLGRIMQQRQAELRRLTAELHQTQTELLFTQVELDQVRKCLHRLDQRLLYAEDELDLARQSLVQASINKQRLMQELQTTRGLLMRCWSRVRVLEQQQQQQEAGQQLQLVGES